MFNRKSKKIQKLEKTLNNSLKKEKENISDFILILENIQEINNEKMQWKHKQLVINNAINLAKEKMQQKIVDIDIDPQY